MLLGDWVPVSWWKEMEIDDLGGNLPPEQEHDESWDETSVYEVDYVEHFG